MLISEKPGTVLTSTTWGTPFVKDEVHPCHPTAIQVAVYRYRPVLNVRGQVRIDVRRGFLATLACILRFIIEESVVADDFRDRQKTRLATRLRRNHATREFTTIEKRLHHHGITRCKGRLEGRLELTRFVYPRHSDARTALTSFDETGQSIDFSQLLLFGLQSAQNVLAKNTRLGDGVPQPRQQRGGPGLVVANRQGPRLRRRIRETYQFEIRAQAAVLPRRTMHHLKDSIKSVALPGVILPREVTLIHRESSTIRRLSYPTVAIDVHQGWQKTRTVHVLYHHGSALAADVSLTRISAARHGDLHHFGAHEAKVAA